MFYSISGKIVKKSKNWVAINTGNISYKVYTNVDSLIQEEVSLLIYENIKEDAFDLYGFQIEEELNIFTSLVSVNGVGPKVALAIMTSIKPSKIIEAIESSNIAIFKSVSGVGNKVAGKIIIELKNKFDNLNEFSSSNDTTDALLSLGYKQSEVMNVLKKIPSDISSEHDKIKWMIKNIKKVGND